jgi:hypothetical protein
MKKGKPEIAGDQIRTIAPSRRAPRSEGVPRRKVARVHAAGTFRRGSGESVVTVFRCPKGHRKVSMRCIWDGGRKPVMRKIICEGDCCGFRSDRWSSTEMGAIRNWNRAVAAEVCSECERRGRWERATMVSG